MEFERQFAECREFRECIVPWMKKDGRLIIQGERPESYGDFPKWFGKEWSEDEYRRTIHACHAKADSDAHWCKWYHGAPGGSRIDNRRLKRKGSHAERSSASR